MAGIIITTVKIMITVVLVYITFEEFRCNHTHKINRGGSRLLKRGGGTTTPVIIVDVGLVRYVHS